MSWFVISEYIYWKPFNKISFVELLQNLASAIVFSDFGFSFFRENMLFSLP